MTPLRALLVEDVEDDARLVLRELKRGGYDVTFRRVENAVAFREALTNGSWDIVLSDWSLPQFGALAALEIFQSLKIDLPFIIVSGTIGETAAFDAMRLGARDYVVKDRPARLVPAVRRELAETTARRESAAALRIAEEQLRQSQKMEAIGALAGGVAHDFNNLLSIILSYGQLLLGELSGSHREDLAEIVAAAERASELTRQLLTFSRKQILDPQVIDLNDTIRGVEKMLRRLVGEDIHVETLPSHDLWHVRVDRTQLEQVIMNLVVNARDALKGGGTIRIETINRVIDGSQLVVITVTDDGIGMDERTRTRVFEPFFTTKEIGKGTGLGLATVFGIIQQSGGRIDVESTLGKGTTFTIHFPAVMSEAALSEPSAITSSVGSERVLVVEDDPQLRAMLADVLTRSGYHVASASDGSEALKMCKAGAFDVVVTDIVMPNLSGPELRVAVSSILPNAKVLFMSGHSGDTLARYDLPTQYLHKPITPEALTRAVREALDVK